MQLAQLQGHLQQHGLPPLLCVFGDTPLLLDDALQLIRQQARQQGIDERQRFIQDSQFDWQQLQTDSVNLGLFSSQRLLELDMPEAKPGREGAEALKRYCAELPDDQILVITGPKLKQDQLKAKWFKLLQAAGPVVQANSPERRELPQFIQQRAQRHQLSLNGDATQLLADWFEGNLLALDQELQKLALMDAPQPLTTTFIMEAAQDQSRFTVFALQDAILQGDLTNALRRLQRLLEEETEVAILNWMLQREVHKVQQLQQLQLSTNELMSLGIWRNQEGAYRAFAQRIEPSHLARLQQLLVRLEFAFKRDSGEDLATLYCHILMLLCQPQRTPEFLTSCYE
ncbi:DNA polymerase III subunit delta [Pseudidiomarina sp. 1APP75-32.1]|uniref:DNA polymerase III subunit delta n=1 Tax=Pseudidiomarina terrestris TaxID=2820060 RepID=A0AAW7QTY3_9GAMM|nr:MULTISPECIES: DNA polymerase III subunit delta [unclassified Pseudidiomarina]MDN7123343.1 DNA polymerase III subunit delta [Pseudidiomarina sp. 1APP75-32.1]MDN7128932.1 DNA polymerase III subunit delta [Pseudidiomarina sp. 1APR75-15]